MLRVVRYCYLPLDPYLLAKSIKVFGGVVSSIIISKQLDLLTCLIFNKGFEFRELIEHFILSPNIGLL
jgi:hypothetical protein